MSAVAVLTLALGIGGATSMFAAVRALLGSTVPPGVDDNRVGRVAWANVDGLSRLPLNSEEFADLASAATAFDALSASADRSLSLDSTPGRTVTAKMVTADFFRTFGCRPSAGRPFSPSDLRGAGRVAVVSEALTPRAAGRGRTRSAAGCAWGTATPGSL